MAVLNPEKVSRKRPAGGRRKRQGAPTDRQSAVSASAPSPAVPDAASRLGWFAAVVTWIGFLFGPAAIRPLTDHGPSVVWLYAESDAWFRAGSALVGLGLGFVIWIAARRGVSARAACQGLIALFAVAASALACLGLFGDHDVAAYLMQAGLFASAKLSVPALQPQELFRAWMVNIHDGRVFAKYPFVPCSLLAVGVPFGIESLVPPLFGTATLLLVWRLAHRLHGTRAGYWTVVLGAASPYLWMKAMTPMSQVFSLFFISLSATTLERAQATGSRAWAGAAGLALGSAFNCRPLTAVVAGAVLTGMVGICHWRRRLSASAVVLFLAGGLLGLAAYLTYNRLQTGSYLLSPFSLYCARDAYGFGNDRAMDDTLAGIAHTPFRAVQQTIVNSLSAALWLNGNVVVVVLGLIGLWSCRREEQHRRWAAIYFGTIGLAVTAYAGHWWPGVRAEGPAYYYEILLPALLLGGVAASQTIHTLTKQPWPAFFVAGLFAGAVSFAKPCVEAALFRKSTQEALLAQIVARTPPEAILIMPRPKDPDAIPAKLGIPAGMLVNRPDFSGRRFARPLAGAVQQLREQFPDRPLFQIEALLPLELHPAEDTTHSSVDTVTGVGI